MTPLWSIGQNYNILLSPASWLSSPGVLGPQSAQQATSTGGSCQERRLPGGTLWCHLLPPRWPAEAGCACAPGSATHSWLLRVATFGISGGLGHEDVSCEQAGPPQRSCQLGGCHAGSGGSRCTRDARLGMGSWWGAGSGTSIFFHVGRCLQVSACQQVSGGGVAFCWLFFMKKHQ